jgi:hypothetical protein
VDPKRGHRSGGELEPGVGFGGAVFASDGGFGFATLALGGAVAVTDVPGERVPEGVPVEVVGVLADELVDRTEGALDSVEIAGVGRRRDEFDVLTAAQARISGVQWLESPSWIQ